MPLPRDENADLKTKLPLILLLAYLAEFILLGIAPYARAVWWKDMLADTLGAVAALLLFYRVYRNPLQPARS